MQGDGFFLGCDDTDTVSTFGCDGDDSEETPMTDVQLVFIEGSKFTTLAVADAGTSTDNEFGQVTWTFEVPEDLPLGRGELTAPPAERIAVIIRR